MNAKKRDTSNQVYGSRSILADNIPLITPYTINITPSSVCNFKCSYCHLSLEENEKLTVKSRQSFLNLSLHNKIIDDLSFFPQRVKKILYCGLGEPLLNKNIADMVSYANQSGCIEGIDIISNGALLSKKLSDKLIMAGLSALRISIQGLNSEEYKKNANVEISFEKLLENIRYFFNNKKDTILYIKIIDELLTSEDKKRRFYDLFGDICDQIHIEKMVKTSKSIEFKKFISSDLNSTMVGEVLPDISVCPQPFYYININSDGKVYPCGNLEYLKSIGDCCEDSLISIWQGEKLNKFQKQLLQSGRDSDKVCSGCTIYKCALYREDILDGREKELLGKING
jgi:radical SAM protein with 4Fe4S-binding SPASM domain